MLPFLRALPPLTMVAAAVIGPLSGGKVFRLPRLRVTRGGDRIPGLLGLDGGEDNTVGLGLEGKDD
jgi:hypothetical protein